LCKTNTVLVYNSTCSEVLKWGGPALLYGPKRSSRNNIREMGSPRSPQHYVAERFKLYLDDNAPDNLYLSPNLDYKKAISDYLYQMRRVIDLTMRTLLPGNKLKKETVETGNLCGSTYVDQEFLHFMGRTVGFTALQKLQSYAYDPDEFETIELDLEKDCPSLIKYITGAERINLEYNEWIIELEFETVKK
ncbi:894_t:CDS:2, partial [Racocetra fulgida]